MPKIIRMPKGIGEGKAIPLDSDGHSEHISRYPRMQRGIHYADFMRDRRTNPEVYHCVIQREGSNEILSWTQHSSLEAAMKDAEVALTLIVGSTVARM